MDRIDITISPDAKNGIIRNIMGMNNSPRMTNACREEPEKALFQTLHPARTRYHDAAIENPGYALIDVSRIFPLFHADENDPRNYQFAATDYYLKMAADCGTKLEFRLGETIEHSRERYRVQPPSDPEKWARICLNIIRHYNEGWADGLHLGIEYWSIWEEPDNERLFDGPFEKYLELYTVTAKAIKKEFPRLKVGGPNTMGACSALEQFFRFCRDTETPVDFAAFTTYSRDPQLLLEQYAKLEKMAHENGFTDTELCISEWHYGPLSWQMQIPGALTGFNTAESAAFTSLVYTRLLDTGISIAFYYAWATAMWGVTDRNNGYSFMPVGHALAYFAEMTECKCRLLPQISGADEKNAVFLCGEAENGRIKVMASFFKSHNALMTFHVPGKTLCRARRIEDNEPDPQKVWEIQPNADGDFACSFEAGGNAVFLFEFI